MRSYQLLQLALADVMQRRGVLMFGSEISKNAEYLAKTIISFQSKYIGLDRATLIERMQMAFPRAQLSVKDDFWRFPLDDGPFYCCFSAIGKELSSAMIFGTDRFNGFTLHIHQNSTFSSAKETPFQGGPTRQAIQLSQKLEIYGITDMSSRL